MPFRPTRASPVASPRKPIGEKVASLSTLDTTISTANTSASSALAGLTTKDVELIDEIIERSPSTATTFLTVFKAYNEVLHERGMDAANDVIYYKLLLKLGVVKGHDWGAKWESIKAQLGYGEASTPRTARTTPGRGGILRQPNEPVPLRARQPLRAPPISSSRHAPSSYGIDTLTVHSHQDDVTESDVTDDQTETGAETEDTNDFESSPTTLIQRDRVPDVEDLKANALGLSSDSSYPPLPTIDQFLPVRTKQAYGGYHVTSELSTETTETPSDFYDTSHAPVARYRPAERTATSERPERPVPLATQAKPKSLKPHKDTSFNDEDTWKKIRMIRDEKVADDFREDKLLVRCWHVWRGGLDWIRSLNDNVAKQHDKNLLRYGLDKWQQRLNVRQRDYDQISRRHDTHLLRRSFEAWWRLLKARKVKKWREEMRRKMALIKDRRERLCLAEAWNLWRLAHRCELIDIRYEHKLLEKTFTRWKRILVQNDRLEGKADDFFLAREKDRVIEMWNHWKHITGLRETGKEISLQIESRLVRHTFYSWKAKLNENRDADVFHDYHIVKNVYATWKGRLTKLRALERKADKYLKRRDVVLVSAVLRVWTSRERGLLMERAILMRRLQTAWVIWKTRLQNVRLMEEYAVSFSNRPSMSLASKAFDHWHKQTDRHLRLYGTAVRYDEIHLEHRMLMTWRIELRMKFRLMKQARIARHYLLIRHAWNKWKDALEERRRQQKLHLIENKMAQKFFIRWHEAAARKRYLQIALQRLQANATARILREALNKWTERIIVLKNREFDVTAKKDEENMRCHFTKWKAVYKRHADDLRLMQSYQYVKREDTMRRMFHRWLSAAKTSRHRRLVLEEREEELRMNILEKAWDKWREKYKAERLRPLEHALSIQLQKHRLYQAFLIWNAKTMSIPAIRFHSTTTKAKFWRVWRDAMPKALQAKRAREYEWKKLLARALDKWAQAYRTKIAMKAVARARYLRLPSGAPRQSLPLSSALSGILKTSHTTTATNATRRIRYPASQSSRHSEADADEKHSQKEREVRTTRSSPVRQLQPLRALKLAIPKLGGPLQVGEGEPSDLWAELRRARRRPPSEPPS